MSSDAQVATKPAAGVITTRPVTRPVAAPTSVGLPTFTRSTIIQETSAAPDASALVKGAPHEDNAKKFLAFTISADVQQLLGERFCRSPVRSDVSGDDSLPDLAGIRLVDYAVDWASKNREGILLPWAFYLGGEGAA